jgi:hypothetical protein
MIQSTQPDPIDSPSSSSSSSPIDPIDTQSDAPLDASDSPSASPISSCSSYSASSASSASSSAVASSTSSSSSAVTSSTSSSSSSSSSANVAPSTSLQSIIDIDEEAEDEKERVLLVKELNAFTTLAYSYIKDKAPAEQQLFALAFANVVNANSGIKGKPFIFSDHLGLQSV